MPPRRRRLCAGGGDARVILTDYRLRGGRLGSDAIAAIRSRAGRAIPAIILTGEIADDGSGTDGPQRDATRLGDVAVLRLESGKIYSYPIANLSDESRAELAP